MKKILVPGLLWMMTTTAYADPGFMFGVSYSLDGQVDKKNLGLTLKIVSTDREESAVVAAGVTLFPWADKSLGLDAAIGYNNKNIINTFGYDFLNNKYQFSSGYINTSSKKQEIPLPSDIRLKRDINLVATLADGMKIYSFKYLWSDVVHVGVMAQDLLSNPAWASAVSKRKDGFFVVNYAALGYRMTTLDLWNRIGMDSFIRDEISVYESLVTRQVNSDKQAIQFAATSH